VIEIDPRSAVPPFEQLRVQLVEQIRTGRLRPGQRLPTVRKLAADLGLAPNTVARTYRELEADGHVDTQGRNGTVVRPQGDPADQQVKAAALSYAAEVKRLGVPTADALRFVQAALRS
jgi:DNA-binding transcriptional regulator YhcF (GntR family)